MRIVTASEIYEAGKTEDGEAFFAEVYFVRAEADNGACLRHQAAFRGAIRRHDADEGVVWFADVRREARAKAERLAQRVRDHLAAGGSLDLAHWDEDFPVYGSEAYQAEGAWWAVRERAIEDGHAVGVYA